MSILGKILIVFNLLLGVATIWLAAQVNAKRQQWSFALLEHELLYIGLPVDPPAAAKADSGGEFTPIEISTQRGAFVLSEIRRTTLQKLFDRYKGGSDLGTIDDATASVVEKEDNKKFVTSQQKELERVADKVFASLDRPVGGQPATEVHKRARLRSWLLSLSSSGAQRDGINALLSDLFVTSLAPTARAELPLLGILDDQTDSLRRIADAVVGEKTPEEVEAIRTAQLVEAVRRASTDSERKALELVSKLIAAPPEGPERATMAIEVGRLLLKARFESAMLPSASSAAEVSGESPAKLASGDKRSRIASILYNLDPIDPAGTYDAASSPLLTDADVLLLTQLQPYLTNDQNRVRADQIFKRTRLARLEWMRRVRFIVGADLWRQVAESQVASLQNTASRIDTILRQEDGAFRPRFAAYVAEAQVLADRFVMSQAALKSQQERVAGFQTALKAREIERDDLKMDLAGKRTKVAEALTVLDAEERKLFALQIELVRIQDRLFVLEKTVRDLETETPPTRTSK